MLNGSFDALPPSPFARLRALLEPLAPPPTPPVSLALGEPQHAPPSFALEILKNAPAADYGRYPPIGGTDDWQNAARDWLSRRFHLANDFLAAETQVLPLSGTREGLFLAAQLAPQKENGLMAMPNPFYQVYASAAVAAGAQPIYLDAPQENNFLPNLSALRDAELARLRAVYLCSPANPQGAIASLAYLKNAYRLAKQHGFLLLVDECYSEIYDENNAAGPPPSILEVMQAEGDKDAPVLVFHSLSKRSNLAGLRSGLVTGGAHVMAALHKLRMVAGPQTPLPSLAAAASVWRDDAHVDENRAAYGAKINAAENIFGQAYGFYRPQGGFFLWLKTGNGEAAAKTLWQASGIKVLPGAYLTQDNIQNNKSENIGHDYIRVALVAPLAETEQALARLKQTLDAHGFAEPAAAQ